jgi:hypothetical protein
VGATPAGDAEPRWPATMRAVVLEQEVLATWQLEQAIAYAIEG